MYLREKAFHLLFIWVLFSVPMPAYSFVIMEPEPVSQVCLHRPTTEQLQELRHQGFDITSVSPRGKHVYLLVTAQQLHQLYAMGLAPEIIHVDYAAFVAERAAREKGVGGGSMGGFHTYSEATAELDEFHSRNPAIVSEKFSIGSSFLGNPIWAIKISDNVTIDEDEPEVFYNALIHAREPQGMECLIYFIDYLIANYNQDDEVTTLVNERELFFVLVVNPDGYLYNQQTNPNGGGQWRKNRRGNESSIWGVDLNRNFGYMWGYDNSGSSPTQTAIDYRGSAAFSEPETQIIRDFCIAHSFTTALNYHTYSNYLIRPFGYDNVALDPASDLQIYNTWATLLTANNNYLYGDCLQTVGYSVNGGSDDWMYGNRTQKPKIFSMTPEVGSFSDNFWPSPSRILPLAMQNLSMNLLMAHFAGEYAISSASQWGGTDENGNGYPDGGETARFSEAITALGIISADTVHVELLCDDAGVVIENPVINVGPIAMFDTVDYHNTPFQIHLNASLPRGHELVFQRAVRVNSKTVNNSTMYLVIGAPSILFNDDASSDMVHFNKTGNWNVTNATSHSPTWSFTDSPTGSYPNNSDTAMTLKTPLSLSSFHHPKLVFWSRWQIEADYDFGTVEVSTDNGQTWQALPGLYTRSGSGNGQQTAGVHGFDGNQNTWVREEMDLSEHNNGQSLLLRFRLRSDSYDTRDGWYLDDISIEGYPTTEVVPAISIAGLFLLLVLLGPISQLRKRG